MTASTPAVSQATSSSKGLRISLSIVQVLLALLFISAGAAKTFQPIDVLGASLPWVPSAPALVRFIGISELLGGIGLVLPGLLRLQPKLIPLAAAGLAVVMVLAAIFHAVRAEWSGIGVNLVIGGLAAFVAWGRFKKAPVAPR